MRAALGSRSTTRKTRLAEGREIVTIGMEKLVNDRVLPQGFHRLTRSHRRRPIGVQPISSNVAVYRLRIMNTADRHSQTRNDTSGGCRGAG